MLLGRNELHLNMATIHLALQEFIDKHFPAMNAKVTGVEMGQRDVAVIKLDQQTDK